MKEREELSVLEQGSDGAIVSVRGEGGPSVLLGGTYLGHLERVLSKAKAELTGTPSCPSALLLFSELETLLATYNEACNKYYGGPAPAKSLAVAMEELDELRKQLNA